MNTQILTVGNTYKIKRQNYGGNTGSVGALIFKGDSISVNVFGSQVKPSYQDEMVNLKDLLYPTRGAIIAAAGIFSFLILPDYIRIAGTVESIELVNYVAETDLGLLPASDEA